MAYPEEHRHRVDRLHGAVHRVPGYGESAVVDQCQRRPWHRITLGYLRCPGALVHFRAHVPHQEAHRQVDPLSIYALLRTVHRLAVLSQILHPGTSRSTPRPRRRAHVGRQSHISHASRRGLRQDHRPTDRRHRCTVLRLLLPGVANGRALGQSHFLSW